uniref:NBS-LRR disease resistance protein n=1 Tax=Dasypyrum villosum TaxID=40247 RepID=A0A8K1IAJ1_9POAL|nr:NBS-LRR disease resistance protein [Dasypyrum villosum]
MSALDSRAQRTELRKREETTQIHSASPVSSLSPHSTPWRPRIPSSCRLPDLVDARRARGCITPGWQCAVIWPLDTSHRGSPICSPPSAAASKGLRREIRSLKAELAGMHGALIKYTKLENPDDQVKIWVSLVRELSYDTEDCFDKFIHQLGDGGSSDGGFKEFLRKTARRLKTLGARHGIASQIDDLKFRIKQVKELKTSYKLDDIDCATTGHATVDPRLAALFAEEAHLVGIDGPRDDLAKWMLEEENKHRRRVLSIVGFGGLGKTTLANEVYRKIQGHFDCHAFVSVSQKPDTRKIIKDVISQVSYSDEFKKDMEIWDEKKSISKLRELLQEKRYLVIIDDIWSIVAWNAISCAFPENSCSSRIVATTRIIEVASSCCPGPDDQIYEMKPLSDLHSERLFLRRIFGSENCCPDMLTELIVQLTKLQHLLGGFNGWKIPVGIGNMTNLREISGFGITMNSVGSVEELGSLINLKVIHVRCEESQECKSHAEMFHCSLCKLGSYKLQSVCIYGGNSSLLESLDSWSPLPSCLQRYVMGTPYCLSKLPKWITPALTSLAYLNIKLSPITEEVLGILGELPALLCLKLYTNTVHKDRLVLQGRGFRCLKELVYEPFGEGAGTLVFEKGALPKLEKLRLCFFVSMAKAYGFYLGIEHLPYLKDVRVCLQSRDATSAEVEAAEVAIRKEASLHANHPWLTLHEF